MDGHIGKSIKYNIQMKLLAIFGEIISFEFSLCDGSILGLGR